MDSRFCMNELCGAPSSSSGEWRKGWALRSGGFATLCDKCGTAYEQLAFCDMFHSGDTGWRDCKSCGKRLHCGCIASVSLLEILDSSGVTCIGCVKSSGLHLPSVGTPKRFGTLLENCVGDTRSSSLDNQINGESNRYMNFKHLASSADDNGPRHLLPPQNEDTTGSHNQMKQEEILPSSGDIGTTCLSNFGITSTGLSQDAKLAVNQANMGVNDACRSPVQTNLTISLAGPSGNPNLFPAAIFKEMELNKAFVSVQQGSTRSQHLLPKAPKPVLGAVLGTNASTTSQIRVARQPVEGRVKNQLLPRYWPRITEQELQQISGDSNSTIVPLFEKVLSASDAGRIGRLVLPKACAEAYFPPISHPEGIPLRIQDVKGKEWMFQFRFWPNNNSRMYVLEGVTPCIQSMQLQAGDTVTFSRMDPEGKLLMGFRKASNSILMQDTHLSAKHNGAFASEPFLSGVVDNLPFMSGYSGLLHSMNGSTDPHLKAFSKHLDSSSGDVSWNLAEKNGGRGMGGFLPPTMAAPERKRSRNIGMKSKRLLIDNEDALELKLTWEEAQEMLRPPTSNKPTTVTIEDHEFEEYNEPPVFGKRSIFTVRLSGEQEQWVPCDDCSKWRRLPAEFLLPPSWRCQDNVWDHSRCSCSAPDELSPRELEYLLKLNNDFKKRRIAATQEHESATPYAAMAHNTIQGDTSNPGSISVATTTKHPRHRPGCSCIVCIQPPSGKGKHKPTCTCNVCMTVKRRFKTLMMRKKKRQSEREAEIAQRNQFIWGGSKEEMTEAEMDSSTYRQVTSSQADLLENEVRLGSELQIVDQSNNGSQKVNETTNNEELDLNSHPQRSGEDLPIGSTRVSMMSLLEVANRPLETYLKQNGLTSLISGQQQAASSGGSHVQAQFHTLPQATAQNEGQPHEDQALAPVDQEQEKGGDDKLGEPDQIGNDPS